MSLKQALRHWLRPTVLRTFDGATVKPDADPVPFLSASRTHVGLVRMVNEDRVLDCPQHGLWAVADGMGGHFAGDIAAEAAIAALQQLTQAGSIGAAEVEAALRSVDERLRRRARNGARLSGATIVVLLANSDHATILWAGDCRAYRLRHGRLEQLTRDHSVVQELLDAGAIDLDQASRHPQAHIVTRALGAGDTLRLDRISTDFATGDIYLLCSDGMPSSTALAKICSGGVGELGLLAGQLLDHALAGGGQDNISLVLVANDDTGRSMLKSDENDKSVQNG
jgi:serine/threonine protein phosphatase PrpC